MDIKQAKEIIKYNYPPEKYTMLREALDWLLKEAETLNKIKVEAEELYAEEIDLSDFGERVSNII
ncbi:MULTISPECIES: hypothetical protein [unclassified Lysinibacillus]|uniref:hypothetical protein n=1 Tax=unclassified Lysinibacillus TaxID=2636778 RepID=UPI0030F9E48A